MGYLVVVADALESWHLPKPYGVAVGAALVPCLAGGRCEAWFVNLCPRCSYRMCSDSCGTICLLPKV